MKARLKFLSVAALLMLAAGASAATLPAPPTPVTLPPAAANAFGITATFGPSDGLIYVWDGASVLKQDSFNSASYSSIGSVGSGSADAGPMAFSRDGGAILVGNGFGGMVGGAAHAGKMFAIPAGGGSSSTAVGTIDFHNAFLAAPIDLSTTKYFVDRGADAFGTASSVTVFDSATGTSIEVITNIPGASTSGLAIDSADNLYVTIGFGAQVGELRTFPLAALVSAYNTATPLAWTAGSLFNTEANNSGAGMFFDARGYLFAGGPNGLTVFNAPNSALLYDNGGYTSIAYDPANDRVLVTGFGNEQGIYPASMFVVPEPSSMVLFGMAVGLVVSLRRSFRVAGKRHRPASIRRV